MPFGVNLVQWQDSADVARRAYASPGAFVDGLQPTVMWLGPGLVALGLIGVAVRSAQLARGWRIRKVDLLIGFAVVLVLGYVNKSAGLVSQVPGGAGAAAGVYRRAGRRPRCGARARAW